MDSSPSSSIAATDKTNVGRGVAMSDDDIKQRLKGVCVYALTNSKKNFVLDKDENSVEAQAKLYFNEKDAKTSLKKVKLKNPGMLSNYEVAPFAVSDILKLMDDEYSFRFIPESKQIGNAVRKRRWHGFPDDSFPGVPVFKPKTLVVRSQDKLYRPVYFRLEDLQKSIAVNSGKPFSYPTLLVGDFEVADLEEMICGMKDDSNTDWDDVMFIPPGLDLVADQSSDNPPQEGRKRKKRTKRNLILRFHDGS